MKRDTVRSMVDEPLRFELDRLVSYDDESLIAELRRVAVLLPAGPITRAAFDRAANASSDALTRRFGGWREALMVAGLADRYSGRTVSPRMREQPAHGTTPERMIVELHRVAALLGTDALSRSAFDSEAREVKASAVERRFGTWSAALKAAGLAPGQPGRRWTDDDYYENLLTVWTYHGRRPVYREMNEPPSRVSGDAYGHRFGTWTKALVAFIERVNSDLVEVEHESEVEIDTEQEHETPTRARPENVRTIRVGLRYEVLRRDHFRCVLCGASPAITRGVVLHVDHVFPVARGGKTIEQNLRSLCHDCNLGKGSKIE